MGFIKASNPNSATITYTHSIGRHNNLSYFGVNKKRTNRLYSYISGAVGIVLYILSLMKERAYACAGGGSIMGKYRKYAIVRQEKFVRQGKLPYTEGRVSYTVYDDIERQKTAGGKTDDDTFDLRERRPIMNSNRKLKNLKEVHG